MRHHRPTRPEPTAVAPDTSYDAFAREEAEDGRVLRRALGVAVLAHLVLLFVHLPEGAEPAEAQQEREPTVVLQSHRWRPPEPQPEPALRPERKLLVPVPDPTPDEPEPIRLPEVEEPAVEAPDPGLVFGIPEAPPPLEEGPIIVRGEVVPPRRLHDPAPPYTEPARRARIQGVVVLRAVIDEEGRVTRAEILRDLPFGLGASALSTVRTWRFEPATLRGRPVAVYYSLSVRFELR